MIFCTFFCNRQRYDLKNFLSVMEESTNYHQQDVSAWFRSLVLWDSPGLTVNTSSSSVRGPGTTWHSAAQCGTERAHVARFGSDRRHQLGQMVCGVTRGSRWRKHRRAAETTHRYRWWGHPHTHTHTEWDGVCYITEVEGLHCLICPGDPQFIAVVMETHTLGHSSMQTHM